MTTKLYTPATTLAVSLADARSALKIDGTELDALLSLRIREITEYAEHIMGRSVMTQTWRETLESFSGAIQLYNPPLVQVNFVKFIDLLGNEQTVPSENYWVDNNDFGAYVVPKNAWPTARSQPNAVTVEYVCGYGSTPASVPAAIQGFILAKLVEQFDPNTKAEKNSVQSSYLDNLLDRYRVWI